ncbi:hypothetical protein D3C81_1987330 [compost metagenome]
MQTYQPVTPGGHTFMPALDELGLVRVWSDQVRQFQAIEGYRLVGGAENQPAGQGQADHQQVQCQVHQVGKAGLPCRGLGQNGRGGAAQAYRQAQPDQHEHRQAQHEVQVLH